MENDPKNEYLNILKRLIIFLLIFLFPIFFTPLTQEFFLTSKFYLLSFSILFLLALSAFQLLVAKKISIKKSTFDYPIMIFLSVWAISTFLSPNKVESFLNVRVGLGLFFGFSILYFLIVNIFENDQKDRLYKPLIAASFIVSMVSIIQFILSSTTIPLPSMLQFMKNPAISLLGNQIDLAIFLGFFLIFQTIRIIKKKASVGLSISLFFTLIALILTSYSLFTSRSPSNPLQTNLTPTSISWYAAVETLKRPRTALLGVGPGDFVTIFTLVKPIRYNQTPLWNVNFTHSRSFLLQIWTEGGVLSLFAFTTIILLLLKILFRKYDVEKSVSDNMPILLSSLPSLYLIFVLLFFPPSPVILFIFFLTLAQSAKTKKSALESHSPEHQDEDTVFSPLYLGMLTVVFIFIVVGFYLLLRSFQAEYYYKKSLDAAAQNKAQELFANLGSAISKNPYIERYRISLANLDVLAANNIAQSLINQDKLASDEIEKRRQSITNLIQGGINEAKAAVALNPRKAGNWEALAGIYRNILNSAQGSDSWAISAYQRAILADPANPLLRLNLGGVYYAIQNYKEAVGMFNQAIQLKSDWPTAHYNLAWSYYQLEDYPNAISAMEKTINVLDPKSEDFKKAKKELKDFKDKVADVEKSATSEADLPPLDPKLKLPKEASPEAKSLSPRFP